MQKRHSKNLYNVFAVIIMLTLIFIFSVGIGARAARADTIQGNNVVAAYEAQNVMDDLNEATFGGEKLDLSIYDFDEKKSVQLISLIEFCYSYRTTSQNDYGLYVYVYNPQGYDFTKNEVLNAIQLRVGGDSSQGFNKYPLKYLNRSTKSGYEGLFYKFKINLSTDQRASILSKLNNGKRIYEVSGIELYNSGFNAVDYKISNVYTYTGYAKGYGSDSAAKSTLHVETDGMEITLTLDVRPTFYRPEGSNGKNAYTQDSLHSVYFSIPNTVLNKYGGLSAVHATWLNAVTNLALVTDNNAAYNAALPFMGKDISEFSDYTYTVDGYYAGGNSKLEYAFVSDFNWFLEGGTIGYSDAVSGDIGFNFHWRGWNHIKNNLSRLDYIFYSGNEKATDHTVTSEEILAWLENYTASHAGELVNGKYSKALFETVDEKFTDINVKADDNRTLTSEKLTQSFWEKLFNKPGTVVAERFTKNIEAIHPVTKDDFLTSVKDTCQALYIDESDYNEFNKYYKAATEKNETVFLFRYQVSDYFSQEATEVTSVYGGDLKNKAYYFKETLNLDFDIIDVTCKTGNIETRIACISSPQDIVHDGTPPLNPTDDNDGWPWWAWLIVGVVALIVLFVLIKLIAPLSTIVSKVITAVWKCICAIFKGLWWVISLPFRLIAKPFKNRKKNKDK